MVDQAGRLTKSAETDYRCSFDDHADDDDSSPVHSCS